MDVHEVASGDRSLCPQSQEHNIYMEWALSIYVELNKIENHRIVSFSANTHKKLNSA